MRDEVKSKGAKFLVATLTNDWQVNPDQSARQQFPASLGVKDLSYPDQRIKTLAEREGIEVVNLAPSLRDYAERNNVFLHGFGSRMGFGHWNTEGNRLAGEALAKALCELIEKETVRSQLSSFDSDESSKSGQLTEVVRR